MLSGFYNIQREISLRKVNIGSHEMHAPFVKNVLVRIFIWIFCFFQSFPL